MSNSRPSKLEAFLLESNRIEGIYGDLDPKLTEAARLFLFYDDIDLARLNELQVIIAPNKPLRRLQGMNVQVGSYVAPIGGPEIVHQLQAILEKVRQGLHPWYVHLEFEQLHPYMDGNGRTGRMLWLWQMLRQGRDPFIRPFLHTFYYQTLEFSED